jgi:hypothetical protein
LAWVASAATGAKKGQIRGLINIAIFAKIAKIAIFCNQLNIRE